MPKSTLITLSGVVAANINERHVYYGNSPLVKMPVEKVMRVKELAEELEKKGSAPRYTPWSRRNGILHRIRHKKVAIPMRRKLLFYSFYPRLTKLSPF